MLRLIAAFLWIGVLCASNPAKATLVYTPAAFKPEKARLLVVIHGCLQSPESMAMGSGWDRIADRENLVVLYPKSPEGTHPIDCWNWFLPENQRADSGQLKSIMDEIQSVKRSLRLKNPEQFVAGISSGGVTVAGLLACFPKAFKAGAVVAGPSYGLVKNLEEAEMILKEGPGETPTNGPCKPRDFHGSLLVIQGSADPVVNPRHATRLIRDFIGSGEPASTRQLKDGETSYSVSDFLASPGKGSARGRLVLVEGLGHAWPGLSAHLKHAQLLGPKGKAPTAVPFFSDPGPSATTLIWDYFRNP